MTGDYPRDLIGYGETPPDPDWPGGARIAVQFVINYEEGGENCILHGDAASEAFLSEIFGAQPWPRSEEHTSELQSLMRISYAVFCLKKTNTIKHTTARTTYKNRSKRRIRVENH